MFLSSGVSRLADIEFVSGSCKIDFVIAIVLGPNPEGLTTEHIACNQLYL